MANEPTYTNRQFALKMAVDVVSRHPQWTYEYQKKTALELARDFARFLNGES